MDWEEKRGNDFNIIAVHWSRGNEEKRSLMLLLYMNLEEKIGKKLKKCLNNNFKKYINAGTDTWINEWIK